MTEIKQIALDRIHPNPHRDIENYPINGEKVDALVRSIQNGDLGLWPSIIARQVKRGYEMAFGHHRLEAAKKAGLARIPLIVMSLTDEQMLQYMGRENGEEYGTDFMVLLNTWESSVRFLVRVPGQNAEPIDIARLLGWVSFRADKNVTVMTMTAQACNAAYRLITDGYIERRESQGLSVDAARNIAQRAVANMDRVRRGKGQQDAGARSQKR